MTTSSLNCGPINEAEIEGLFDDLEALAHESPHTGRAAAVKDLDDLDALMAESIALREEDNAGKAYRELLKRGGMSKEDRRDIEAKLQEWESKREWQTLANVALFRVVTCACGQVHTVFGGMYYRQKHRTQITTTRLVAAKIAANGEAKPDAAPANEVIHEEIAVPMCAVCASAHGFQLSTSTKAVWQ